MACAAAAVALAACGNETDSAPPDTVAPADALLYAEVDLTLGEGQQEGLAALVENVTGKAPEGDPLLAAVEALSDGKAGPLTRVRGDLPWLGDKIAYVSIPPLREQEDHGVVAIVTDADEGIKAIADAMGEKERDTKIAGAEATRFGSSDVYAAPVEDDYLVVGGRHLVERVLQTADGGRTLAANAAYKRGMQGRGRQLASVYLDLPRATRLSGKLEDKARENLGAKALAEPFVYGIDFEGDTATFDGLAGGTELDGIGVTPLVEQAPSDAWGVLGFRDLREKGIDLLSDFASLTEMPEVGPGPARRGLKSVGLDLERDVFGWMGDAAVWVAGKDERSVRFGLIIEVVKDQQARATLAKLRLLLNGTGRPDDFTVDYGDGTRTLVTLEDGQARLTYEADRAKPARGTVMEGPLGKAAASMLDGGKPAMLADAKAIQAFSAASGGGDAEWQQVERFLKPFTTLVGLEGPKGGPRVVGRIR
jgi:hypothetical protein